MTTLNKIEAVLSVTQHAKGWTKADSDEPTPISATLLAADKMMAALRTVEAAHPKVCTLAGVTNCVAGDACTVSVCGPCGESWPCPTITAIREALG